MNPEQILRLHADELARRLAPTPASVEWLSRLYAGGSLSDCPVVAQEARLAWQAVYSLHREWLWLRLCAPEAGRLPKGLVNVDDDLTDTLNSSELARRVLESDWFRVTYTDEPVPNRWLYLTEEDYWFIMPSNVRVLGEIDESDIVPGGFYRFRDDGTILKGARNDGVVS